MTILLMLGTNLVVGIVAGALYFGCVWWNARLFANGGRVTTTVLMMLGRLALMGGLLFMAVRQGAIPLLLMALGVLLGRFAVMRGSRASLP